MINTKKKKIGILTFHWGTNYGGVLQAYALQYFLIKNGFEVEIINYAPHTLRDNVLKCFYSKNPITIFENLTLYLKERNIKKFRSKYLHQTKRYFTPDELVKNPPLMDIYISGSDQVWNPYGLKNNGKVYFLPFGTNDSIKLSYAASFGITEYPDKLLEQIKPLLRKFKAISVREKSGLKILKKIGINDAYLLADPTLLLSEEEYSKFIQNDEKARNIDYFFYILQKNQFIIKNIYKVLKQNNKNKIVSTVDMKYRTLGVEDWLSYLKNSNVVVTNSFHGVVFSIIFKKPFVVVPIEGRLEGMNDRIITLLENFNLSDRIIWEYDINNVFELFKKPINWDATRKVQMRLQLEAEKFIAQNIKSPMIEILK